RLRLTTLGGSSLHDPLLKAAIQDRDVVSAEVAKHEPAARRGSRWRIVVDDDPVVATDTEQLHRVAELLRVRKHVRRWILLVAHLVDIEKTPARNVRLLIFLATVPAA